MVISEDSQLGLRFLKRGVMVPALEILVDRIESCSDAKKSELGVMREKITFLEGVLKTAKEENFLSDEEMKDKFSNEKLEEMLSEEFGVVPKSEMDFDLRNDIWEYCSIERMFVDKPDRYFLIQSTVYKAAELIRVNENFTGRTLKDIKLGSYVYLMGKHEMVKFVVVEKGIKGIWYDDKKGDIFEWGVEMSTGKFFYTDGYNLEFSRIMQILTFIELGDISVKVLSPMQKEKGKTKEENTYNASINTVYVVDSTWNQIVVRTEGFAVRGHFRLQPCGAGMMDRKLIWINAFEKDGYIRKPKASIIK